MDTHVKACVNHGRWIASCECNGAELIYPGELFICGSEHYQEYRQQKELRINHIIDPQQLPENLREVGRVVDWPENKEEIDHLLSVRSLSNQNWEPGEGAEKLMKENAEHLGG